MKRKCKLGYILLIGVKIKKCGNAQAGDFQCLYLEIDYSYKYLGVPFENNLWGCNGPPVRYLMWRGE